jgi:acetyltransferase-like isoleucine patch superfamily enzyme
MEIVKASTPGGEPEEPSPLVGFSHPPVLRLSWRPWALARVAWTLGTSFVVECIVFGLAVVPAAAFWAPFFTRSYPSPVVRTAVVAMMFVPAYLIFAFFLMVLSALAMRLLGWRTPPDAHLVIERLEWPLLDWVRYIISIHLVRLFAGSLLRATPLWTFYLRLNGARLGRGVYVNSLAVSDHNLLEFDDHVVIGDGVHLSGHTVERAVVKTARVRLGRGVTIGIGSVVGIGVEAGPGAQVGALSLVPKFSRLEAGATYVGAPVRKIEKAGGKPEKTAGARPEPGTAVLRAPATVGDDPAEAAPE